MSRFRVRQLPVDTPPLEALVAEEPTSPESGGSPCDASEPPYSQKAADKFACFRTAVSRGHQQAQLEKESRSRRLEKLRARAAVAPPGQQDALDRRFWERENRGLLAKCHAWSTDDFVSLRVLGQGTFGTVHLVRRRRDGQQFALKQIDKARYSRKNRERLFVERDALVAARGRWCVTLHATFQDDKNVYMVMDFLKGGDLMFHLIEKNRFTLAETAFYMAELMEGLDFVHKRGFIHRDVKPDNVVLGPTGHLKLLDFGLAKQTCPEDLLARHDSSVPVPHGTGAARPAAVAHSRWAPSCGGACAESHVQCASTVGTFEYMAPEAFFRSGECGPGMDLWSVGIIAFECLAGGLPFNKKHLQGQAGYDCMHRELGNYRKIFAQSLQRALAAGFTDSNANQFLSRLVCPKEVRLSVELARREPFFAGLDLRSLHLQEAPFAPECAVAQGSWNFDDFGTQALPAANEALSATDELEWALYGFDREADELNCSSIDSELVRSLGESCEKRPPCTAADGRKHPAPLACGAAPNPPKGLPAQCGDRRALGGA